MRIYGCNTSLHYAIYTNDIVRVKQLLKTGNPNLWCKRTGETPMHLACRIGNLKMVKLLRRHSGIEMDLHTIIGTENFPFVSAGYSARTLAEKSGKRAVVKFLENYKPNNENSMSQKVDELTRKQEKFKKERDDIKEKIQLLSIDNEDLKTKIRELESDHAEVMGIRLPREMPTDDKLPKVLKNVRELERDLTARQQKIWAEKEDENKCTICAENVRDVVLVPCGHFFCNECADQVNDCPNCREAIQQRLKTYK